MGMWQLLCNNEVVDTVNLKTSVYEEAHTYFRLRKNLDNDSFNILFIVKEYIEPENPIGNVKWWNEESTKLDEF